MTTTACDSLLGLVLDTRGNPLLLPPSALLCSFWRLHSVVGKKAHVDRHDESNVGRDKSFTPAFRSNQPGQVIVANREEGRAHVPARDLELPEEAACAGEFLKVHRFPPPFPSSAWTSNSVLVCLRTSSFRDSLTDASSICATRLGRAAWGNEAYRSRLFSNTLFRPEMYVENSPTGSW